MTRTAASAQARRPDVLRARHDFFDHGSAAEGLVPDAILRSWRRCAERGFDSQSDPRIEPVGQSELRELQERNGDLISHCRPELERLAGDAREAGGLVILTDGAGSVLDTFGDKGFAGKAAGVALRPGVRWAEASTGTNAIGTALVERRPIEVRGDEHFFEPHRILNCAAAPILDPRGALVGALDLSGAAAIPQLHALSLVKMGVDQIEHRMFSDGFEGRDVLRLHADPALLGTAQEGVLVFEGARLVAANRHGLKLLDLDWNALGARSFGDMFDAGHPGAAEISRLRSRAGVTLHGRLSRPAPKLVAPAPAMAQKSAPDFASHLAQDFAPYLAPAAIPKPPRPEGPVFDAATAASLARAARLVDGDVPILIQGETGCGKEVFARAVHAASARSARPFVAVNCAAIPESLIEAELFGYEHGAFTGARRAGSKGLLREAEGGVLFLDEIGDMPLGLQTRLLRVVQDRTVAPLGGGKPTPLDVRLICATHRDVKALTASDAFRQDLYFRLAQFTFALPPLRDLPDRAGLIAAVWDRQPVDGRRLGEDALAAMRAHDWPGNHRELVGVIKALIALSDPGEVISAELLPASVPPGFAPPAAARPDEGGLDAIARDAMLAAIEACEGNVAAAARKLGVSRSTLYRRALNGANG